MPTDLETLHCLLVGKDNEYPHTGLDESNIFNKRAFPHKGAHRCPSFEMAISCYLGAVQKLRNGQRGEGVDDFVTYCYVYFEVEGVIYDIIT